MKFRVLLAVAAVVTTACKDEVVVQGGLTGIELTVTYRAEDELDQLEITGRLPSGDAAFEAARIPEGPKPLEAKTNSVVLLLPDTLADETVTVRVDGLRESVIVATERTDVTIVAKVLVDAAVTLGAPAVCGDGVVRTNFERCDDANAIPGDGCDADCIDEPGWTCSGTPSVCERCGDGALDGDEGCDDNNVVALDGCSDTCVVEHGYDCLGVPSTCTSSCSDGLIAVGAEACDDDGAVAGDGCSDTCTIEAGYTCTGEPSVCSCEGDIDLDSIVDCVDTCIDADGDNYGAPGGGGDTCLGPDCDDAVVTCTDDCTTDVDTDTLADCADTCLDGDGDMYGIAGGAGDTCVGPDCDDAVATCNTDCVADLDTDALRDCEDTCIDGDLDGYGVAGGAGNTCTAEDCDDDVATCTTDCTTNADNDALVDCADGCLDADGDGYGLAGGTGNSCTGTDCDDNERTCNTDCTADVDADATIDCLDTCIDADGDNYGVAGGAGNTCVAADCNDGVTTCTTDCTTNRDGDTIVDCLDTCLDGDGDNYGVAGGAGNSCTGPDCNDTAPTCTTDCIADVDNDAVVDCADTCIDGDGDNYGLAGGAGNTCVGVDCDDTVATCTTDCNTNADGDTLADCADGCIDGDGDNYGVAGGAGNTCTGADCDDTVATCNTDCIADLDNDTIRDCADGCIDADGDGYGINGGAVSTCTGADCDDTRLSCNVDCVACRPSFLTLTAQTPVAQCGVSTLTIDLDAYEGALADLSCTAPAATLLGPDDFESGRGSWDDVSNNGDVSTRGWPDNFPTPSCSAGTSGDFLRFTNNSASFARLVTPLDLSGLTGVELQLIVGYRSSPAAGTTLDVSACCGSACNPAFVASIPNTAGGGTDNCSVRTVPLPSLADCNIAMIRFDWPDTSARAGIDDVEILSSIAFNAIADDGLGMYSTAISSCRPTTFSPMCTWDDGQPTPRSDTAAVTFQ